MRALAREGPLHESRQDLVVVVEAPMATYVVLSNFRDHGWGC